MVLGCGEVGRLEGWRGAADMEIMGMASDDCERLG